MGKALIIAALFALLALAAWVAYQQWILAVADIPGWAWAMFSVGGVFLLLIGCGLMALMFYSSRYGYDEAAQQGERERDRE